MNGKGKNMGKWKVIYKSKSESGKEKIRVLENVSGEPDEVKVIAEQNRLEGEEVSIECYF